eukprot:1157305-Pelagomonas_calceolata.AAC.15
MSSSWDDALDALKHLEVVQGLPGQDFPPSCEEERLQPTAPGHAVSNPSPPPAPPPPRLQQQQQQQTAAAPAVLDKNPSQL